MFSHLINSFRDLRVVALSALLLVGCLYQSTAYNPDDWITVSAPYDVSGRILKDVYVIDLNTFVVVGGNETNDAITSIFRTEDRGENWDVILDILDGSWLKAVDFPTPLIGYAVGKNGFILKTLNGGLAWDTVLLSGNAALRDYNDVVFFNENLGFAVGGKKGNDSIQTIIKTINGGADWSLVQDIQGPWLNAIHFVNSNVGFACGDNGSILKTVNGGDLWTAIQPNGILSERILNDIYFLDENNGFAVGGVSGNDSLQTIIRTIDGGDNWTIVTDAAGAWLTDIEFSSSQKGLIVGSYGEAFFTENEGQDWSPVTIPNTQGFDNHMQASHFLNNDFGVTVGYHSQVLIYESDIPEAPFVHLNSPSIVSADTVILTGLVNANGGTANVFFDYGPNTNFGTTVPAMPASVSGSTDSNVEVLLENISSGINYCRLRAVSQGGQSVSETRQFYVGNLWSQANLDFEEWSTEVLEVLQSWVTYGVVSQQNSYNGSIAANLESVAPDTLSAIIFGDMASDNSFYGGFPVSSSPDSLVGYFNYDIVPGGEAIILMVFRKNGATIEEVVIPFSGSSNNSFERLSFPIDLTTQETPDSIVLGIANANPFTNNLSLDNYLAVDDVSFISATQIDIPNSDFENWEMVETTHAIGWFGNDHDDQPYLNETAFQTTDSQHGLYAMRVEKSTVVSENDVVYLATSNPIYGYKPSFPVAGRHQTCDGFIKYDMQNVLDTLRIEVHLFSEGIPVSHGSLIVSNSVVEYTPFSILLEHNSPTVIPDSAYISFQIGQDDIFSGPTTLFIDNLGFDGVLSPYVPLITTIEEQDLNLDRNLVVYPNPTDGLLIIDASEFLSNGTIGLFDLKGRLLKKQPLSGSETTLDLTTYPKGMYLLKLISSDRQETFTKKVIVN